MRTVIAESTVFKVLNDYLLSVDFFIFLLGTEEVVFASFYIFCKVAESTACEVGYFIFADKCHVLVEFNAEFISVFCNDCVCIDAFILNIAHMDKLYFFISEGQVCQIHFIFFPALSRNYGIGVFAGFNYIVFNFVIGIACNHDCEILSYSFFALGIHFEGESFVVNIC